MDSLHLLQPQLSILEDKIYEAVIEDNEKQKEQKYMTGGPYAPWVASVWGIFETVIGSSSQKAISSLSRRRKWEVMATESAVDCSQERGTEDLESDFPWSQTKHYFIYVGWDSLRIGPN